MRIFCICCNSIFFFIFSLFRFCLKPVTVIYRKKKTKSKIEEEKIVETIFAKLVYVVVERRNEKCATKCLCQYIVPTFSFFLCLYSPLFRVPTFNDMMLWLRCEYSLMYIAMRCCRYFLFHKRLPCVVVSRVHTIYECIIFLTILMIVCDCEEWMNRLESWNYICYRKFKQNI